MFSIMYKKFAAAASVVCLISCAAPTPIPAQQAIRGELSEAIEWCGESLGTKCANGTFQPKDSLVIHRQEGKEGLVFDHDEKIAEAAGGKTCDFVVEEKKIKSYSNCK